MVSNDDGKIIVRYDTAENWKNANPVLNKGEIGVESNTNLVKIGNGITAWNALNSILDDYLKLSGGTINGTLSVTKINCSSYGNDATIENNSPCIYLKNTAYARTLATAPTATQTEGIYFRDSEASNVGYIRHRVGTSSQSYTQMGSYTCGTTNTELNVTLYGAKNATTGSFYPSGNGVITLGISNNRWGTTYNSTGNVTTSDERAKSNINKYSDEELDAWAEIEWCNFQMNDSIKEKGVENARIHNGLIAQRIQEIFSKHNLNASRYAFFCYDEWDETPAEIDENGNIIQGNKKAGNIYSLRYSECFAIESAYQRRRADRLEERIAKLEVLINNKE